jgi:hypothetical protein
MCFDSLLSAGRSTYPRCVSKRAAQLQERRSVDWKVRGGTRKRYGAGFADRRSVRHSSKAQPGLRYGWGITCAGVVSTLRVYTTVTLYEVSQVPFSRVQGTGAKNPKTSTTPRPCLTASISPDYLLDCGTSPVLSAVHQDVEIGPPRPAMRRTSIIGGVRFEPCSFRRDIMQGR